MRLPVRIGTRGSPLALAQADIVARALVGSDPALAAPGAIAMVPIRTTGDRVQDRTLAEIGGKGLFTKEIDEAMLAREIDLAVHSMKDLPTVLPDGIVLAAQLEREDPRDVLLLRPALQRPDWTEAPLALLPRGARVGTASLRRQAQLLAHRPDLAVAPMRGNVGTRLDKLGRGEADAALLALAGLRRLGLDPPGMLLLPVATMLPAVAQGAIAITAHAEDAASLALAAAIGHAATALCVAVERGFLAALDGSCRTPIAGLATLEADGALVLGGLVAAPDGRRVTRRQWRCPAAAAMDAAALAAFGAGCGQALAAEAT